MDSNTQVFKKKRLGLKGCATYNSELNLEFYAQFKDGIIIDCNEVSILVCDCASHVPGALFEHF